MKIAALQGSSSALRETCYGFCIEAHRPAGSEEVEFVHTAAILSNLNPNSLSTVSKLYQKKLYGKITIYNLKMLILNKLSTLLKITLLNL